MKKFVFAFMSMITLSAFAQVEVTTNGDVGIGTTATTLSEKLILKGGNFFLDTDNPSIFWNSNRLNLRSKGDVIPVLSLRGSTNWASRLDMFDAGDATVNVRVRASGLTFFNGGNVGIGLLDPAEQLHVGGNILIEEDLRMTAGEGFRIYGDTDYYGAGGDAIIFRMEDDHSSNGNTDGSFVFEGHTTSDGNSSEWMVIRTGGRVGIGNSTPQQALSIHRAINTSYSTTDNSPFGSASDMMTLYNTSNSAGDLYTSLYFRNQGSGGNSAGRIVLGNETSGAGFFAFHLRDDSHQGNTQEKMRLTSKGNLGIGTTDTFGKRLAVNGEIIAQDIISTDASLAWPDYVFEQNYELKTLSEVEKHIETKGHLPNIPSAKEVEEEGGVSLGEMNKKLLEKVEELTLYLIDQNKRLEKQEQRIKTLEKELKTRKE